MGTASSCFWDLLSVRGCLIHPARFGALKSGVGSRALKRAAAAAVPQPKER